MDFKITIGKEIEVPMEELIAVVSEAVRLGRQVVEDSNLFIVEHEGKYNMAMIPNCDCKPCGLIKDKIRAITRSGNMTEEVYLDLKRELREFKLEEEDDHDLAS